MTRNMPVNNLMCHYYNIHKCFFFIPRWSIGCVPASVGRTATPHQWVSSRQRCMYLSTALPPQYHVKGVSHNAEEVISKQISPLSPSTAEKYYSLRNWIKSSSSHIHNHNHCLIFWKHCNRFNINIFCPLYLNTYWNHADMSPSPTNQSKSITSVSEWTSELIPVTQKRCYNRFNCN